MKHDKVLYALIALILMIGGALVIKPMWFPQTEEAKPVAKQKAPVAMDDKAPVEHKAKANGTSTVRSSDAGSPHADESSGGRDLTPICEEELRRTADLIRFFANRIQMGEETKSVVADMRQQEKRISEVCHD
jgi:flagellar biosynthesis/type III secretory pathway M-ring protein FliF/YscJ